MDTNKTHIKRYSNWFNFFPYYNKNTISNSIGYNMYYTQNPRLTLDYLIFDPITVYNHGLTYTSFSCVKKKKSLYFSTITNDFFQIDPSIAIEMCCLQRATHQDIFIPKLQFFILSIKVHDFCTKMIIFRLQCQNISHQMKHSPFWELNILQ